MYCTRPGHVRISPPRQNFQISIEGDDRACDTRMLTALTSMASKTLRAQPSSHCPCEYQSEKVLFQKTRIRGPQMRNLNNLSHPPQTNNSI